ncbi:TetR/AcrR family transcriptional regulator [Paenibacillus sp. CF384]|uniref:TetR/AcrR family transcriptional regulator n=1 Tax=Paenibacillus sp. CF384 TaxID=1884382 RepID=UPI0008950664|nr:TetR/AcrR family transcriptional regulator [Paenibacillus sp. CF384]SDW76247.1 transcriptional regulator, TetR family [Paenibacillus sp. CF384]
MELKARVMKAAIEAFDEKGIRFTMDDLSAKLGISKRTLYEQIGNKEDVIRLFIQEAFASIKEQEQRVLSDASLDVIEKLKRVIPIMPAFSDVLDYRRAYEIEKTYPELFAEIEGHLQADWDQTLALIEEGIKQQRIKPIHPLILKEMIVGTMDRMLKDRFLLDMNLTYDAALKEMIEILFTGILLEAP